MVEINKLHFKNNVEILRQLPDNSVDAFFEDPPFNSTDCKFEYSVDLMEYWDERKRVAKETASFIIKAQMPFTFVVGGSNIQWYRHRWIWQKDKCANFQAVKGAPMRHTEDLLVFQKFGFIRPWNDGGTPKGTYNPQMREGKGATREKTMNIRQAKSKNMLSINNRKSYKSTTSMNTNDSSKQRYPDEILYYPVPFKSERIHPTQSPVDLWRFLIRTYTNVGDTIFDGYSGSGTIPVAADIEARNWIACENSEEHFPDAENRIKKHLELKKYGYAKTEINNQTKPDLFTGHY